MPIYRMIKTETTYEYMYVDAETEEAATEIAQNSEAWRSSQKYNCEVDAYEADYEELPGNEIVWDNDGEESEYEFDSVKHTPVQFLIEKEGEGVWAYFPCEKYNDNTNLKQCYAHVSQHSACSPEYAKECKEAVQDQYRDLLTELTVIGYTDLKILNKDWNTTPEYKIGDIVELPEPNDTDDWTYSFEGMVTGFRHGNVQVTDGDGDVFECEPERLIKSESETTN